MTARIAAVALAWAALLLGPANAVRAEDAAPKAGLQFDIDASAGSHERPEIVVEVSVFLTDLLKGAGIQKPFDPRWLNVTELSKGGETRDRSISCQFDAAVGYDPLKNVAGRIIFLARGSTPAQTTRYFRVIIDVAAEGSGAPETRGPLQVADDVEHEGQKSIKVTTPTATYYYHKEGAGFASLEDRGGNDWISYRPGGGPDGAYRGIPNIGKFGHPGNSGPETGKSAIVSKGPLKVTIRSVSNDGKSSFLWEIYRTHARLTVEKAGGNYWFLYEGTPGGRTGDEDACIRSSKDSPTGERTGIDHKWQGDLPGTEWVHFTDRNLKRALFLVHHEEDDLMDSYWRMKTMTVFGFGRLGMKQFFTATPQHFTIGLCDDFGRDSVVRSLLAASQPLTVRHDPRVNLRRTQPVAAEEVPPTSTRLTDWPHWRGPNGNGIVSEDSGWEKGVWPPKEPLWQAHVGLGASSPLVVDGRLYTMGWDGKSDNVLCLDAATGKELWRVSYPCRKYGRYAVGDTGLYAGINSTPEYDVETGYLYTLSVDGDLNCWNTKESGRKVWGTNLYDKYQMPQRPPVERSGRRDYGYTTAPLVYGDWVIVEVGGKEGDLMAFSKRTGERVWASQSRDLAGHTAGLALMTVEGIPCVVALTHSNLLVARLDKGREGQTVAEYPYQTHYANSIASPAVYEDSVLITSAYNHRTMTRLKISLKGATRVWEQKYASGVGTPVIYNNHVYSAWQKVRCLDFATGDQLWEGRSGGAAGSCIVTGDGRLIVWVNKGDLHLVETADRSPNAFKALASKKGIFRREVWPHVVLSDGRLYCRDRDGNLACFSLRPGDRPKAAEAVDEEPVDLKSWPGNLPGLVMAWQSGLGTAAIGPGVEARDKLLLKPRGEAKLDEEGNLEVTGGAFLAQGADAKLLNACKKSGQLSIEAVLMTHDARQVGPARIISFSADPYKRNFTLGQQDSRLVLRLRTPSAGENGMRPETTLCPIRPGQFHHVLVSYRNGYLTCYLDGELVAESRSVRGNFSNWSPMHLLFGDEYKDRRDWKGKLERVALHSRFIGPKEAAQRFQLCQQKPE